MINIGTSMTVEEVSPELAQQYLSTASVNRRLRQGKIDQYARDMLSGRWHTSVIRFAEGHVLVDGQHRLWAVIAAGMPSVFYVERGVSPEAVKTIDSGLVRTAGDVLAINGEVSATVLASAIRFARWFDQYQGLAPSSQSRVPFSADEVVDYLEANPGLRDTVRIAKNMQKSLPSYGSGAIAAALQYLEEQIDETKAREFWEQMKTGAEMRADTGAYALRNLVINDRLRPTGERLGTNGLAAVSIKAWNAWRTGRPVRTLRWQRGEQFPHLER